MRISVVILTHDQRALTLRCLASLAGLADDVEVIVVDNGSADATADAIAGAYPRVRVIRLAENRGVAAGRNVGLRAARGRYLMILDNDTIASSAAIEDLAGYLDANPGAGLVAPRLCSPEGRVQSSFRPFPGLGHKLRNIILGKERTSFAATVPSGPVEPFYVIGAAQMFRREVYRRSGGLDEKIFFGPEDADFCMAVRRQGLKVVYDPRVAIIHDWQRSTTRRRSLLGRSSRRHIAALIHFYIRHRRLF